MLSDKDSDGLYYVQKSNLDNLQTYSEIFGKQFSVQAMTQPKKYLPQYQQNRIQQITFNQQCLNCCGQICLLFSCCFGICGCSSCCCTYNLPTSYAGLVQNFGQFNRLLVPGFNLINPCSDQVSLVDLKLQVVGAGRNLAQTKDQVGLTLDTSVSYRVINPIISHYVLGNNLRKALCDLTISSLRSAIASRTLQQVLSHRQQLADQARELVKANIPPGIKMIIPQKIQQDLTSAARQKRLSQAMIIQNKADVQSAELMRQSAELLDSKAAIQIRYLQMIQKLGQNGVLVVMDIGADKKGHS